MKKIILLSTAAVLLSPIAAKANQKSSVLIGLKGVMERQLSNNAADNNDSAKAVFKNYDDENFFSGGVEAAYTYKVYGNWLVGAGVSGMYAPEHEFEKSKGQPNTTTQWIVRPELTAGYEFQVASNAAVTPFIGVGAEFAFYNEGTEKDSSWTTKWTVPALVGARVNVSYFYATLAARFDTTATDLPKDNQIDNTTLSNRMFGGELSVGVEF